MECNRQAKCFPTLPEARNWLDDMLCDKAGIERFSMYTLRHTYATRAIESGMQPKVLQKLLGHAGIKTTMDRYVHVSDDSPSKAVMQFENSQRGERYSNGTVTAIAVPRNP